MDSFGGLQYPVSCTHCLLINADPENQLFTFRSRAQALVEILDGLQLPSVGVVAHSYGTFMASRLVQRSPSYVRSMTLLDPCTFNMFTGQLIHSFV